MRSIVAVGLVLAGCSASGNPGTPGGDDAAGDAGNPDAQGMPPPPALGAQLDRMGRPGIGDLLIAVFPASGPAPAAQKDGYNRAADPSMWAKTLLRANVTVEDELAANIAAFDAIDTGQMLGAQTLSCGNTLGYIPPVNAQTYHGIADLLADDELVVDTSRATCGVYLALELEYATSGSSIHTTCGGRTPAYDALDVLISVLVSGIDGLDQANAFGPRLHAAFTAHTDVKDSFPFLGPPNP